MCTVETEQVHQIYFGLGVLALKFLAIRPNRTLPCFSGHRYTTSRVRNIECQSKFCNAFVSVFKPVPCLTRCLA